MESKYDILIAGGGMAGLSQALALADTGLKIAVVDRQKAPPPVEALAARMRQPEFSDRVSALTPASRDFLQTLKVWQALEGLRVCPYYDMQVWDADGTGSIHFSADELHVDCLGYLVENDLLTCVLAEAAAQKPDLSLSYGQSIEQAELHGDLWEIELDSGEKTACSLLIGADGGNSLVRELAGFELREWSYVQGAVVCSIRTELPHAHTAWQRFMSTGPLAYLPLCLPAESPQATEDRSRTEGQHFCSIVWSCDEPMAAELLALPEAEFALRVEQGLESRLGWVQMLSTPQSFPLRQRHAKDYVREGVALVGDAAHTIHPLAGQGINLGFADVQSLSSVIKQAMTRQEDFCSRQVLSRYQRARKPENLGMMLGMEGFKRVFGSDDLLLRLLRNQGLNLADRFGPLKHRLMKQAMGLNS